MFQNSAHSKHSFRLKKEKGPVEVVFLCERCQLPALAEP